MDELDCQGMSCPLPIVKINNAMRALDLGETLQVKADDPAFKLDLEAWVSKTGHQLVDFQTEDRLFIATLQKA
jgi:tRNA 2-thiouridine synthesizing protein A